MKSPTMLSSFWISFLHVKKVGLVHLFIYVKG